MNLGAERFDNAGTFIISRQSVIPDEHFLSLPLAFALFMEVFVVLYKIMLLYLCTYDTICE
jgi:hypothetical protein